MAADSISNISSGKYNQYMFLVSNGDDISFFIIYIIAGICWWRLFAVVGTGRAELV